MSVKRRSAIFLFIAFAVSWTAAFIAWRDGMTAMAEANRYPIFSLFPFGPAIAGLICTLAFERRRDWLRAFGLGLRPNWWWLFALLFPLAIGFVSMAANIVVAGHDLAMAQSWKDQFTTLTDTFMTSQFPNVWVALVTASLIALLTEEPGWRGYLYHLWRDCGFWSFSLTVGLIWALWHLPMFMWFGLQGDNGLLAFLQYACGTTILAVYCTLIRDGAGSMIPVAIFHGAWNTVGNHGAVGYFITAMMVVGIAVIAWRQWERGARRRGNPA